MKTENKTAEERNLIRNILFSAYLTGQADMRNKIEGLPRRTFSDWVNENNVLKSLEEYGNQRFLEGKKEAEWIDVNERPKYHIKQVLIKGFAKPNSMESSVDICNWVDGKFLSTYHEITHYMLVPK